MATTLNSSADYQEDLFQAIDTIVQARIADLPYDKTIECKVIDISNANNGIYTVQYENAKFQASSLIKNLAINDLVYVQVPLGDFRKDKIIIAIKMKANTQIVKTLPFLSFIKGNNLFTPLQNANVYNIKMNSGKEADLQFTLTNFEGEDLLYGFTRMGIKASMSTNINNTLVSGDYGIKITIYGYDQKQLSENYSDILLDRARHQKDKPEYFKEFTLTKADMVGTNLYNTHGYQNQEKVFNLSGWVIDNIIVTLWQDNNFKDINGNLVNDKLISYTGLSLYFGYDENEFKKGVELIETQNSKCYLRVRTKDGLLYNPSIESTLEKHYELYCLLKNENNNTYLDISYLIKNIFYAIERYDPSIQNISLRSNKYAFSYNSGEDGLITDELTKRELQKISITKDNKYLDFKKNGFTFLLFKRDSTRNYSSSDEERNVCLNNQETEYLVSNELWFVNKDNANLLDDLIDQDLTEEKDDSINVVSGVFVYSGPELLFKSTDGKVILRLSEDNAQLYGHAETASGFKKDNKIYNLADTFGKINEALKALSAGDEYKLFDE